MTGSLVFLSPGYHDNVIFLEYNLLRLRLEIRSQGAHLAEFCLDVKEENVLTRRKRDNWLQLDLIESVQLWHNGLNVCRDCRNKKGGFGFLRSNRRLHSNQFFFFQSYCFQSKKLERKIASQFSCRVFLSFSWNCPWRAEFKSPESLVCCIKHVSGFTAVGKPQVVGSNLTLVQNSTFLDTPWH